RAGAGPARGRPAGAGDRRHHEGRSAPATRPPRATSCAAVCSTRTRVARASLPNAGRRRADRSALDLPSRRGSELLDRGAEILEHGDAVALREGAHLLAHGTHVVEIGGPVMQERERVAHLLAPGEAVLPVPFLRDEHEPHGDLVEDAAVPE